MGLQKWQSIRTYQEIRASSCILAIVRASNALFSNKEMEKRKTRTFSFSLEGVRVPGSSKILAFPSPEHNCHPRDQLGTMAHCVEFNEGLVLPAGMRVLCFPYSHVGEAAELQFPEAELKAV